MGLGGGGAGGGVAALSTVALRGVGISTLALSPQGIDDLSVESTEYPLSVRGCLGLKVTMYENG